MCVEECGLRVHAFLSLVCQLAKRSIVADVRCCTACCGLEGCVCDDIVIMLARNRAIDGKFVQEDVRRRRFEQGDGGERLLDLTYAKRLVSRREEVHERTRAWQSATQLLDITVLAP